MNQLLFFAELREKVGEDRLEMDVKGKSVKEVKELLSSTYSLNKIEEAMVAINEEFALKDSIIEDGDTIAFIPPVSGG